MIQPKRLIYLGYYAKETDWKRLRSYVDYAVDRNGVSRREIWRDIFSSSIRYNISFLEYFLFGFYKSNNIIRETFAGTGYMYEYQKLMNPLSKRKVLLNKARFFKEYASFIKRDFATIKQLKNDNDNEKAVALLNNESGKIVLKSTEGQCGDGIEVRNVDDFTKESLVERLEEAGNDMVEEFVVQHEKLNQLSPSGLNTVRIMTQLDEKNKVNILGASLRITVNSQVDNLAAGNIAAPIDLETGRVSGPAVYSDIFKEDKVKHPVTNVKIPGIRIPFWKEALAMVKGAALTNADNRSIGWDVAITDNVPELIEGNHDWCKLLWQLPVRRGLKSMLEPYRKAHKN